MTPFFVVLKMKIPAMDFTYTERKSFDHHMTEKESRSILDNTVVSALGP